MSYNRFTNCFQSRKDRQLTFADSACSSIVRFNPEKAMFEPESKQYISLTVKANVQGETEVLVFVNDDAQQSVECMKIVLNCSV